MFTYESLGCTHGAQVHTYAQKSMESRKSEDVFYNTHSQLILQQHTLLCSATEGERQRTWASPLTEKHTVLFHFLPQDVNFCRAKVFPVCMLVSTDRLKRQQVSICKEMKGRVLKKIPLEQSQLKLAWKVWTALRTCQYQQEFALFIKVFSDFSQGSRANNHLRPAYSKVSSYTTSWVSVIITKLTFSVLQPK